MRNITHLDPEITSLHEAYKGDVVAVSIGSRAVPALMRSRGGHLWCLIMVAAITSFAASSAVIGASWPMIIP